MIKEAIDRILELQRPSTFIDNDGIERHTSTHQMVGMATKAHEAVVCSSLESLCEFAKSNGHFDSEPGAHSFFFEVTGPASVSLVQIEEYDGQDKKETVCECKAILPAPFQFGQFMDPETFIIRSVDFFERNEAFREMLSTVSSVTDFNAADVDDDGLSQTVTTKSGVGRKDRKMIDPFVHLRAYRTFREIEQPEVTYLLRVQKGPSVALFEASGYHWKITAVEGIADYIINKIPSALVMK